MKPVASREVREVTLAIFVPSMAGGGAERVMAMVANGIASLGYSVDLVLANRSGPYLDEVEPGVNIVDLGASRVARSLIPLMRYLKRRRPSVLLSALMHANVIAVVAVVLTGRQVRVMVSERDAVFPAGDRLLARWTRALTAAAYRRADGIITVSDGVRQDVIRELQHNEDKVITVHNPIDIEEIERLALQPTGHSWLDSSSQPVFLAVGRLEPAKGFDVLLEAVAKMRSETPVRLVILGEGSLRDELVDLAGSLGLAHQVDFPGFQRNPFSWMARCDVFVLSSRNEGLPNVLIQAMACGARIVSTDCPHGPAEILEGGRWGSLVPVGDADALALAMEEAIRQHDAPAVTRRARDFSKEQSVRRYVASLRLRGEEHGRL